MRLNAKAIQVIADVWPTKMLQGFLLAPEHCRLTLTSFKCIHIGNCTLRFQSPAKSLLVIPMLTELRQKYFSHTLSTTSSGRKLADGLLNLLQF